MTRNLDQGALRLVLCESKGFGADTNLYGTRQRGITGHGAKRRGSNTITGCCQPLIRFAE